MPLLKMADLFEVGELDQLHGDLRVLQLHGLAHACLGVRRGEADQRLQSTGRHWRGLEGKGGLALMWIYVLF